MRAARAPTPPAVATAAGALSMMTSKIVRFVAVGVVVGAKRHNWFESEEMTASIEDA